MSNIQNINSLTRYLCDADSTSLTDANLLILTNQAYEEVIGWLLRADGRWNFDDTNYSTFPIAYTTLVNAQSDYAFASDMIDIQRVEVEDSSGIWQLLKPLDKDDVDFAIPEFLKTPGMPEFYDKEGASLLLYPAPATGSVTLTNGMRIYYKRTASIFTSAEVTTGTKEPGFASPYHNILSYMAAIPYCMKFKKDRVQTYSIKVEQMKQDLLAFYAHREEDERKVMSMKPINPR